MTAVADHLQGLSPGERRELEAWLLDFEQSWDEKRLARRVRQLPQAGRPRRAALIEMVKIDLEHRWEAGRQVTVEHYLKALPELGNAATVPVELLLAEYAVRRQFGAPCEPASFEERFPRVYAAFQGRLGEVEEEAPTTRCGGPLTANSQPDKAGAANAPAPDPSLPRQFGRYRILQALGKGSMGTVYLAHDGQLDRQVALKVPHFRAEDDADLLERFYREGRAASTLDHPNLCPVYDVGVVDGTPYLTMPFIEGQSLAELMSPGRKPCPPRQAATLVRKLALGLEEAHRRGVIHRDLKPANIKLNPRNEPVILDFGLARRAFHADERLTQTGQIMGTPAYMAPEQVRGDAKAAGPGADIYSLGVICYELLTGQRPFRGAPAELFGKILTEEPVPPSALRPGLDPALEAVCLRAMAKRPEDRFATMKELASTLTRYLKGEAEPAGAAPTPARVTKRPSRWRWVAAAAVVAGVLGLLAFLGRGWFGQKSEPVALRPDAAVQTLTVTLHVGPGEDLKERVALDLGLGFPLWLEPAGSRSASPIPFGAVPQQTTVSEKGVRVLPGAILGAALQPPAASSPVPAGSSATFTFAAEGEPGQDVLRTSPYLLAGVRVSDISRVGFTSLGSANWELAGYEVKINDKPFLANQAVHRKANDAQQEAKARLAELGLKSGPLEKERADLRGLAKTGLARADDTKRLNEVEAELAELAPQKIRLERQLRGQYPWYVEQAPGSSPERERSLIKSVKLTVVTDTHGLADTRSYGYFRTGGHKYLIGGPDWPLTGDAGPQEFALDLVAGPLTRDDLRGWALGLLGTPAAQAGPDRWHPRRLMVEIDGKLAYDSEQESLDRHSLEVIRLVPPCHLNEVGKPVLNPSNERQVPVWEAGQGLGWDEGKQEAKPLPAGVTPEVKLPPADPQEPAKEPEPKKDADPKAPAPAAPLFPGEWPMPPEAAPPPQTPAPPAVIIVGVFPQIISPPSDNPGQDPDNPDPGHDPSPAGTPFQIDSVRISSGNLTAGPYTIDWTVWGDESKVHHYEVYLDQITPSHLNPLDGASFTLTTDVPPGMHTWSGYVDTGLSDPHLFLAPRVVAVPVDPASTTPATRWGPARPIFPTGAISPPVGLRPYYWYCPPAVSLFTVPPTLPPMPPPAGAFAALRSWTPAPAPLSSRAVWTVGESSSHWGINFDTAFPGKNVVVRPSTAGGGTERVRVWLQTAPILDTTSARTVAADMGFSGGGMANHAKAHLFCYKVSAAGPIVLAPPPAFYDPTPAGVPVIGAAPMVPLDCPIPAGGPAYRLLIGIDVEDFVGDPAYPPALWGVRVVPTP